MSKIPWYIIIGLVVIILLQRACTPSNKCPSALTVVKHDTSWQAFSKHDTVRVLVPYAKIVDHHPEPITITDTVFETVFQNVDTAAILRDYFATRFYSDTNSTDIGKVIIRDSVTQNKIKWRDVLFDLKFPVINNLAIIKPHNQVYIGIDVGGTNSWISFGPQFTLKTASDKMYHFGASYTTDNKFYFHLGTDWKIHF